MTQTLGTLCDALGLTCPDSARTRVVCAVKPLPDATAEDISFLDNPAYKAAAATTKAAAAFVRPLDAALLPSTCVPLVTPQPYVAFAMALTHLYPAAPVVPGVHATASIAPTARVAPTAQIGPFAVLEDGAVVEDSVLIGPHAVLGQGVTVGAGSRIGAHVTLQKTTVGKGCILHPGVRTGQDGFGFALHQGRIVKIPQVGGVRIGNDVEIGANTTIDCGALADTIIEDMVKIDNQVQIGHNVRIGKGSRIVAQVGVAGSSTLGAFTVIGGQSGIAGHVVVADEVQLAARSGLSKSVHVVGQIMAGWPAVPLAEWRAGIAIIARMARAARKGKAKPAGEDA